MYLWVLFGAPKWQWPAGSSCPCVVIVIANEILTGGTAQRARNPSNMSKRIKQKQCFCFDALGRTLGSASHVKGHFPAWAWYPPRREKSSSQTWQVKTGSTLPANWTQQTKVSSLQPSYLCNFPFESNSKKDLYILLWDSTMLHHIQAAEMNAHPFTTKMLCLYVLLAYEPTVTGDSFRVAKTNPRSVGFWISRILRTPKVRKKSFSEKNKLSWNIWENLG